MCTISIIVPAHNVEAYIQRCIESIVRSTIKDYEILIVENASSDNTLEICKALQEKYEKIRLIVTQKSGLCHARNLGIKNAKGKYFTFVDSDDYVSPLMYQTLVAYAEEKCSDMVCCDFIKGDDWVYDFGVPNEVELKEFSIDEYCYFLYLTGYQKYSVVWNKIFKREKFQRVKFDEELKYFEDRNYILRCINIIEKIHYVDVPLYYYYRGNENSISISSNLYDRMYQIYGLQKDIAFLEENDQRVLKREEYVYACLLQNADFRLKRAKEEGILELQEELRPVIKYSLLKVKRAKYLKTKDKYRYLLEHYSPVLLSIIYRFIKRLTK